MNEISPQLAQLAHQRFVSLVAEAEAVILRTAYSSTIAEGQDFSAALYDADRQLLGQTRRAVGSFVGTLGRGLRGVLDQFGADRLGPGDTLITNDPWLGGGHLPDILSVTPVFHEGELVAYAVNLIHVSDIGGKATVTATDRFEEGLFIPPSLLYRSGQLNEDVLGFIQANSRLPHHVVGDVQAQNAANTLIARRVNEFLAERGLKDLSGISALLQERAERMIRERIRRLPEGDYRAETYSDGVGRSIRLSVCVSVRGDTVTVDFDGTDPQVAAGLNVPFNMACSEALYALRVALGRDVPLLEGSFRPFRFSAPDQCIVNPRPPAPTMVRTIIAHNINSVVMRALAQLAPEYVPLDSVSANFGGLWTFRFRSASRGSLSAYLNGGPPQLRSSYTETYFFSGGTGALGDRDGYDALPTPANCANVPIEIMESRAPILFESKHLEPDTAGAGRFRGGFGQTVTVRVLSDTPIDFIPGTHDRVENPPWGLRGGRAGSGGRMTVDGKPSHLIGLCPVSSGQRIVVTAPGGGGYGDPQTRDPAAVELDLRRGLITAEAAARDYLYKPDTERSTNAVSREESDSEGTGRSDAPV